MRILLIISLLLCCATVMAQQTVITTNTLPLGIRVRKAEFALTGDITKTFQSDDTDSDEFYDISELCQGFDAIGLPEKMVVPVGSQVILFLPKVNKNTKYPFGYKTFATSSEVIKNFDYVYKGDSVAFLGAFMASPGRVESVSAIRRIASPRDGQPKIEIYFTFDYAEPKITAIREANEVDLIIRQYEEGKESDQKLYRQWLDKGYADSLDSRGLPFNPQLPSSVKSMSFTIENLSDKGIVRLFNNESGLWANLEPTKNDRKIFISTNMSPGTYQLVVEEASKRYGKKIDTYSFSIAAPLWSKTVTWLVATILIILVTFLVYRFSAKRRLNKLALLKKISDAELKAIRAQLNPHFLFNALNAIQNLVNKQDTEMANQYIVKLSKLLRLVLSQSDDTLHALAEEVETSKLYLELENMRTPFSYDINITSEVSQNMLVPSMILQPYLENAVIHGVVNGKATHIQVSVFHSENACVLEVSDNGKGSDKGNGNGKGMSIGKERLDIITRQLGKNVKASVLTRKLPEGGFRVTIEIPKDL